ncbi:MAG: hypothetical protein JOZ01_05085 [Candidatus Eremiobacteraeota bacterium]|nr:hypothetical protein [Candidatus Eremiobacteraeota bacterium]
MQSLAEGGLALFVATLCVIASLLGTFVRGVRGASPWVVAAAAASVALALHQIADYLVFYPKVAGAWWLLAGIACARIALDSTAASAAPA